MILEVAYILGLGLRIQARVLRVTLGLRLVSLGV